MDLTKTISAIRERIADPRYQSEGAVRDLLVLPIIRQLGWDDSNPDVVVRDVDLADYGLAARPTRPSILIRVRKHDAGIGQDRELLEYASHEGVPLVCFTDGKEWDFYLSSEQGSNEERRLYRLDLIEREPTDASAALERYASCDRVKSGAAIDDAKRDFREASQQRLAAQSIPRAWRELIDDSDELLIELIAERTESICGFRPSADEVEKFLVEQVRGMQRAGGAAPASGGEVRRAPRSLPKAGSSRLEYRLLGENRSAPNAIEALFDILRVLSGRQADFWGKMAPLTRLRKRTHLARNRGEIFPDRPDLLEQYTREIVPGWWINSNVSNTTKTRLLEAACKAANLRFGRDLQIRLPNT